MIKVLLLDFYGVVRVDTYLAWVAKYRNNQELIDKLDDINHQLDLGKIDQRGYITALSTITGEPIEDVRAHLESRIGVNQELLSLVNKLRKKGIITAVLSNDGSTLRQLMEDEGIAEYFDKIFVSSELGMMKPDPWVYKHVITELGVEPHEIIFFDDRQANVDGALRVGMQAERFELNDQVRNILSSLL